MGVLHPVDLPVGYHPVAGPQASRLWWRLDSGLRPGRGAVGRCQVNGMKREHLAQVQAASAMESVTATVLVAHSW
jgi:hypothetical protein